MYKTFTKPQLGTIDQVEFKRFAGELCNVFSKDWVKAQSQFDSCLKYLPIIPNEAFKPMARLAAESWESWPRNMVRAIKELFFQWKSDSKIERTVTDCEYCNSVGFFSGGRKVDVKTGVSVWYWHTWRCGNCANWRGVIGDMVPMAYTLQIKSDGYVIKKFSSMQKESEYRDISKLVASSGTRINEKVNRPEVQHYSDEVPF